MNNVARLRPAAPPTTHTSGFVSAVEGGRFTVRLEAVEVECAQAASCLLQPVVGDRVVVYQEGLEAWVLAVLERPTGTASDVVLEGDATVSSREGVVTLRGPKGVRLESPEEVRTVTARVRMLAERADLAIDRALLVGKTLHTQVSEVRAQASTLDLLVGHLASRVKSALRQVDEVDVVRAGRIDYRAESIAQVEGKATVVHASEVVKVDGAQIQLG